MTGLPLVFCAVATKNKLAHARTLTSSILKHHPAAIVHVLLVDPAEGCFDRHEEFRSMRLAELRIPDVERLAFKYTAQQFCGMLKSWMLKHLQNDYRGRGLVYLDATSLVTHDLQDVSRHLARHQVLVTPHLTSPLPDDGRHKNEADILRSGAYNSGFVAVRTGSAARRFVNWWADRVLDHCMPERGACSNDQKWFALVPGMFPGVGVLRDPGHNVAYWNLHDRLLSVKGGQYLLDGAPCRVVHFSGYEPAQSSEVTRYQNDRVRLARRPDLRPLFDGYRASLIAHGFEQADRWPYAFDSFDNGVPVCHWVRRLYRELRQPDRFGNPFETRPRRAFFRWLNAPVDGPGRSSFPISHLWHWIWRGSVDLRRLFPDVLGRDRRAFTRWVRLQGGPELGIAPELAPA